MKKCFFRHRGLIRGAVLFFALGYGAIPACDPPHSVAFALQAARSDKRASAGKPTAGTEVRMPFHPGEELAYRVSWASFSNAATVELSIPQRRDLFGWSVWHFQAAIHTSSSIRTLFPVDDQFDSYTDVSSLECRQFEMYLKELGKDTTTVLHLIPTGLRPRIPGPAVIVPPGTRDPLGMLLTLRGVDWERQPEVRATVYDGHNFYQVIAQAEASNDSVQVDAGSFSASRVSLRVLQNGRDDSDIRVAIWFANDPAHMPVQFIVKLPLGSLRVGLANEKRAAVDSSY